jgi:hypothetical protein
MMTTVAVALAAGALRAADVPGIGKQPTEREKAVLRLTAAAAVFRTAASEADGLARALDTWGSAAFKAKWERDVWARFGKEERLEWADFFSGAVVWLGGVKDGRGVAAFYSPWSDGALLVQLEAGENDTQLIDFAVVSGESLRGGTAKNAPPEASLSLYPAKEPLIIALARLYGPASSQFAKLYPLEGGNTALIAPGLALRMDKPGEEIILVKARMLLRMKMFKDYLGEAKNRDWVKAVAGVKKAIRTGDEKTILAELAANQHAGTVKTVCVLPKETLAGLSSTYFIPAKDGALAGFVNPQTPRWVVAVTFEGAPQDRRTARIELLDLELSDRAVELWDKGVTK